MAAITGLAVSLSAAPGVVLNEVVPANTTTLKDEDGDSSDWFELFNAGNEAADLEGWGLSDSPKQPFKWVLHGTTLPADGFLTVFASGKDRQPTSIPSLAPDQVSGLKLWLAADTVQTNSPAEVRRTNGLVFVRRWTDRSGQGNDATQDTETLQPLWVAQGLDGHPALRFDGANDVLALARPLATNSFTLIAVCRTGIGHEIDPEGNSGIGGVSGQHWLFGAQYGGDFDGGAGVSVGTNGVSVYEHGSFYMPALAVYAGDVGNGLVVLTTTYSAKRPSLALQGKAVRTGVPSPRANVTAPTEIGAGYYGAFNGDIAEVLLFDHALSAADRVGVENYLGRRHGLSLGSARHTNFKLSADGETLVLTRPDGVEADRIKFGAIAPDISLGRQPDGLGPWLLFAQPTPGASNTTPAASELLSPVAFSVPAGFYTNAFTVALSVTNAGATIRYTLDGSAPTELSPAYDSPLGIRSRAGTPNGISTIPTVPGGPTPAGEVFKGTVVRARAYKSGALASGVATQTYFVDARGRTRYSLPVVSLNTDAQNLFDAQTGIYVPGAAPNGNYSQRGPEWERPVSVELFETDGTRVLAQEAGVSIHGNTSQGFPIKGLDLNGHGGRGRSTFKYRLFPNRPRVEFDHFLVRPSGQDQQYAFMRDELMQSLMSDTGAESQAARACVTFINGEYWGLSYLKEKQDEDTVTYYGNQALGNVDFLEGYAVAKAGDTTQYDAMLAFLGTHDLQPPADYAYLQTQMEVTNYIDYKAAEIFNYRWDIYNHRLWRPRSAEGRWRWLQFDNDVGWGGFAAVQPAAPFNMLQADLEASGSLNGHNTEETTFLLRHLMGNGSFRRDFVNRLADLLNTTFLPSATVGRVNTFAGVLEPEMAEHTRRWRAPSSLADWHNQVQALRNYAQQRPGFLRQHVVQKFGLSGTAVVHLAVSDPAQGRLRVNTLDTAAPTNAPWTGTYFRDVPLTFVARPAPHCRFVGWQGLPGTGTGTNAVTFPLTGDLTLTALFVPEELTLRIIPEKDGLTLMAHGPANEDCTLETSPDCQVWRVVEYRTLDPEGNATSAVTDRRISGGCFYRLRFGGP